MRTTYVLRDGQLVEKSLANRQVVAPMVMRDIQPYQSMIDGSMIQSRSRHREHLNSHNCIEVGNESMETTKPIVSNEKRREVLRHQLGNISDDDANKFMANLREQAHRIIPHRR